jgi:hypothetical protein
MATNQKNQAEEVNPFVIVVGLVLVIMMGILFWERFHTPIATAYSYLRLAQFSPFMLMNSLWGLGVGVVLMLAAGIAWAIKKADGRTALTGSMVGMFFVVGYLVAGPFSSWFFFFKDSDKSLILFKHLMASSLVANAFTWAVVVLPFAVWIARKSLSSNPTNHKHFAREKDYTLHTFTDVMSEQYPHLGLFRKLNLTARPINEGKYRMADTEKQFVIVHDLLDRVKGTEFKVNRDRSAEIFRGQMGGLWTGFNGLTRWEFAVMAVLLPRIAATDNKMTDADYKDALATTNSLLAEYWKAAYSTYDPEKDSFNLDLSNAKAAIKKYGGSVRVKRFLKAHAYTSTIIYSMLTEARTLGVLQPAEFRWLRVVDRRLSLTIDNVGKIVAFAEVAGIYSHFLYEIKQKRALEKPMVDPAVKGLIDAVESFKFSDDEIEQIQRQIGAKEAQAELDLKAMGKKEQNYILSVLSVGAQDKLDIFEVAVLTEKGQEVFATRCKPEVAIDALIRQRFLMTDADVDALAKAPTSKNVRDKLLETCNGHHVVVFSADESALIPGLDRSASRITVLTKGDALGLMAFAALEGIVGEGKSGDQVRSAVEAAQLARGLYVAAEKKALLAASTTEQGARI